MPSWPSPFSLTPPLLAAVVGVAAVVEAEGVEAVAIVAAVAVAIAEAVVEAAAVRPIRGMEASVTPLHANHHHPIHDLHRRPTRGLRRPLIRAPVHHPVHMARQPRDRRDRRFSPELREVINGPLVRMVPGHR